MKNFTCLLIILACIQVSKAQTERINTDSIQFYEKQLLYMVEVYQKSPEYQLIQHRLDSLKWISDNYGSLNIYTCIFNTNFENFNSIYQRLGFSEMDGPSAGLGLGFTFKRNRSVYDLNIFSVAFDRASQRGDEKITFSFGGMFEVEYGYDLIKSKMVNLYPYAGVGLRMMTIDYKGITQTYSSAANITGAVQSGNSVTADMTQLGYQAGIGLDIVLSSRDRIGGTMFFVKAGTNNSFNPNAAFDFQGYKYNPQLEEGKLAIMTGFKFFGR